MAKIYACACSRKRSQCNTPKRNHLNICHQQRPPILLREQRPEKVQTKAAKHMNQIEQRIDTLKPRHEMITRSRIEQPETSPSAQAHHISAVDSEFFPESSVEEIRTLIDLGCFEIAPSTGAAGHRIYRAQFVDKLKVDGTKRSRLCVAARNDHNHGLFTAAPTMRPISLRLLLSIAVAERIELHLRDIGKAFVMLRTPLRRLVFMQAPRERGVEKGHVV